MYLERISLTNFKSYEADSYRFSMAINCIVGENGSGKTNLLDAIYFLALTKSAFSNQDGLSINHKGEFMMLDGVFVKGNAGRQKLEISELDTNLVNEKDNSTYTPHSSLLSAHS